jgi:RsiW-degrading membrane proteinase PrsW (M82 family)
VLDSSRFGRTPVIFLLGLAACSLVAIVALVLVVIQRGPAPALVGLLLALLPFPLLVALILYLDRLEPEPRALLAAIFGTGAGIAVITAVCGRALHTAMITAPELGQHPSVTAPVSVGAAIGGALVAETLNGLVLLALLASRRTEIDGAEDGVVYGSMVGSASPWWPTSTPTPRRGTTAPPPWPRSSPVAGSAARCSRRCSPP